jgi:hypothetical protein
LARFHGKQKRSLDMAKLNNLESVWVAPVGQLVTVGNNRQIARDESGAFVCYLHGSAVARIKCEGASGIARVALDSCGYLTTTTLAAMRDFLGAFGVTAGVSRAGGRLSARWKMPSGAWREADSDSGALAFTGHRYI